MTASYWMDSSTGFDILIPAVLRLKQGPGSGLEKAAKEIARLYQGTSVSERVCRAIIDPFFPISLYIKHHFDGIAEKQRSMRDLALMSEMYLRIRRDISHRFDNRKATTLDLGGDAFQKVFPTDWCSLCGECCQLNGTIPDPPEGVRYPGYWYAYIAGDSPLTQRFCPFLFELPPQGLFFCAIHNVKPRTCLAYGKKDCQANHPGKALNC